MRRTVRSRSLAPVAMLALVAALAAGCGDGDKDADDPQTVFVDQDGNTINPSGGDDDDDDAVAPLTADQIAQAVLQPDNMGTGWAATPSTDDGEEAAPGCLADADALAESLEKQERGGTEFAYGDSELPFVESTASAYADEAAITAVFDQVQTVIGACTTISAPDGDGNQWELALTYDEDPTYDDVDDQLHIVATGTLTQAGGSPTDITIEWTNVRVGPNVGAITTVDIVSRTTEHAAWSQIAVDRLVDVIDGEEPEATTAPEPA